MKTRTEPRRRHAAAPVTVRTAGWITAGLLLATAGLGPAAHSAAAASVNPTPINSGNPTCASFAPQGASWNQFKLDGNQLGDGIYSNGTITVTISNYSDSSSDEPGAFDWAADHGIDAVFVKAGSSKHNLYVYDPEATSDDGLGPQAGKGNGISHISFCYDADATNPPATEQPTDPPSNDPTDPPSSEPTDPPSSEPTDPPSSEPSSSPSADPSVDPTDPPSSEPTDPPSSSDPNGDPTSQPSNSPSSEPTDPPSADPTDPPSSEPTDPPSSDPTDDPSTQPTDDPSTQPTDPPTTDPTDPPLSNPTDEPSTGPTGAVLGATSDPKVTPPPTDTLSAATSTGRFESWRLIAVGLAMVIVSLLLMPARSARSRARR
jgi:hypothetical protein